MVKIRVISIVKKDDKFYKDIINEFTKMSLKFAKIENLNLFSKELNSLNSEDEIKRYYTNLLVPYLTLNSLNIALDPNGENLESFEFSKLLTDFSQVNFFIGGAYGFEKVFLNRCQKIVSLSNLTFSHKIAKVVLYEQIFRGLSIVNNHPYHK